MENINFLNKLPGNCIQFSKDSNKEILRFSENGDIYVKGVFIENDKEVVLAFRDLLSDNIKKNNIYNETLKSLKELISFCEFHGYNSSTEINNARATVKKATE